MIEWREGGILSTPTVVHCLIVVCAITRSIGPFCRVHSVLCTYYLVWDIRIEGVYVGSLNYVTSCTSYSMGWTL